MIVYNVILYARGHTIQPKDIINFIVENESCNFAWNRGNWKLAYESCYSYNGTGRSSTKMGTICLVN